MSTSEALTFCRSDESEFVCHKGYVSLFPFLLQHVSRTSPHLGAILDLISSPDELWSDYGIRSLSVSSPLFGTGDDYWRGAIWIPMNWLALKALKEKYTAEEGPYQDKAKDIYARLRHNIVENVYKVRSSRIASDYAYGTLMYCQEHERTGYVWEQYDANTGQGRRSHPFTGWTALVTMSRCNISAH